MLRKKKKETMKKMQKKTAKKNCKQNLLDVQITLE